MLLLYMSLTLETYLKSLNLPSLKAIVKFHNAHQKIKMTGKKEELIQLLLSKYDSITDGKIKSKIFYTPTFDIKPKPRKKPQNAGEKDDKKEEKKPASYFKLLNKQRFEQAMADLAKGIAKRKQAKMELVTVPLLK